ncbi:NAD(P)/FAD-dependent oxidoreductase [Leifsonia sp. LS-T14]|uniref:protoporphyrinogen/coproporphyrinogen oxidase n=1 Tax=unclassified Leifsonia TaxID=2663824 RepID=UPI0035A64C2D
MSDVPLLPGDGPETTDEIGAEIRHVVEAPPTRIVVIGGGMAGLVVARECARPGFEVLLLEASGRVGGSVAPLALAGLTLDAGAESFATRGGQVAELLDDLGFGDDVVQPNPSGAWVRHGSRSVPLPKAGLLGIPSSPLAKDVIAAIGAAGAFRAYLDRLIPVLKIGQERRLGTLVRKRMGRKVLELLVAPVATGVYSASPDDLDVEVVAPGLNAALTRLGSLSGAVGELRASATAGSAVGGIRGGMWRLPEALAADIEARGGEVRTDARAVSVERWSAEAAGEADGDDGADDSAPDAGDAEVGDALAAEPPRPGRWIVRTDDGDRIVADAVVIAAPADASLALLAPLDSALADLASLDWPAASSVELATLVIEDDRLASSPVGTGVLVADVPGADVRAKAMTHSSAKWAWVAEAAGAGRHVVRLSYGRAGRPAETIALSDAELRAQAVADASRLLNIPIAESSVAAFARTPWTNALPYATVGQRERIERVRSGVDGVEGLEVTGSWLTGTGLASVIPDARRTAERVRGLRWKSLTDVLRADGGDEGQKD